MGSAVRRSSQSSRVVKTTQLDQLRRGDTFIAYDEATQTANIVSKNVLEHDSECLPRTLVRGA
jgi:hypothetical protein